MSYLDELNALLNRIGTSDESPNGDAVDAAVSVVGETPFEIARRQLANTRNGYREDPEGTFRGCGSRFGCGYAESCAVVDPQTGLVDVGIDANLHLSPEHVKGARKLFRRLNQSFIIPGLMVDDEGWVHFRPEKPCDLASGDDLDSYLGKGFATIHAHAHMVAQIEAGRAPWDVLRTGEEDEEDEDEEEGVFARLSRLLH